MWALAVYILAAFLMLPAFAQAKVLVISDIDDTLKVAHVLSKKGAASSAFDDDSRFVGMSNIFQALQRRHSDIEFHYVSLAPRILMGGQHRDFVVENGFPLTALHLNPGIKQDPELKQKVIRKLITKKKPELIIYFGDNGQYDAKVYKQMDIEFPGTESITYIREAYSKLGRAEYPTMEGQIGFVTSVEVAIDLIMKGLLAVKDYKDVEDVAYSRLLRDDGHERFGEMVFPWWQDCRDFRWTWELARSSEKLDAIKAAIAKKCGAQAFGK